MRAEILAAFVNAVVLVVIAVAIAVEALRRFGDAPDVPGGWLVVVAAIGIVVNGVGAAAVFRGSAENLNLRASFIHLAGDALGSLLVIAAGLVILATGFEAADPIASLCLAALILWSAWGVLRESTAILMEGAPSGLGTDEVARDDPLRAGSRERPRPPRVDDLERLRRALRTRPRATGRGLPRPAARARGRPPPPVRDRPHDAPGRPLGRRAAPDHASLSRASRCPPAIRGVDVRRTVATRPWTRLLTPPRTRSRTLALVAVVRRARGRRRSRRGLLGSDPAGSGSAGLSLIGSRASRPALGGDERVRRAPSGRRTIATSSSGSAHALAGPSTSSSSRATRATWRRTDVTLVHGATRASGSSATSCGARCLRFPLRALVGTPSSLAVIVDQPGKPAATVRFALPPRLPATADRLYRAARARMLALASLSMHETLGSGLAPPVVSTWTFGAPDRMSYEIAGGSKAVVIGTKRWDWADGRWTRSTSSPLRLPAYPWQVATGARLLGSAHLGGRPVRVLARAETGRGVSDVVRPLRHSGRRRAADANGDDGPLHGRHVREARLGASDSSSRLTSTGREPPHLGVHRCAAVRARARRLRAGTSRPPSGRARSARARGTPRRRRG